MMVKDQICWVLLLYAFFMAGMVSERFEKIPMEKVSQKNIIDRVNSAINFLGSLEIQEDNIRTEGAVDLGSPVHGVLISYGPDKEALAKGRAGEVSTRSTQMMVAFYCQGHYGNARSECTRKAARYTMLNTKMHDTCLNLTKTCNKEEYSSPYRTVTGECNHKKSHQGKVFTPYRRLMAAFYSDDLLRIRRAVSKATLPNARSVSSAFTKFDEVLHDRITMAVLQWGQFIEQDLSRPAVSTMYNYDGTFTCCGNNGFTLSPRYYHYFCESVNLSGDYYYSKMFQYCMNYVKSLPALRSDCSLGPQEQMNQVTHFLDGSQMYGSTYEKNLLLRGSNGRYKTSNINNEEFLPLSQNPRKDCLVANEDSLCFVSGDPRVNFEPQMVAMHTLWAREHNRLVDGLKNLNNTQWIDHDVYEEARRIVIAMMQHITYDEWARNVLDKKDHAEFLKKYNFLKDTDPSVVNSFGVAAIRSLKSLYTGNISLYSEDRTEHDHLKLHNLYYKPDILKKPGIFDSLVRGMATQPSGKIDMYFAEDLINKLYIADDFGYDILTLDIQRGRDHGLPPYNNFRKHLAYKYATSFKDLGDLLAPQDYNALAKVYEHPNDIDLIVGGLLERPASTSLFGPTFSWSITNQLKTTRLADRYFYTNPNQPKPFTESQLEQIKKITLARIMCDNSNIRKIQPNVFQQISESNNLVSCDSNDIPRLDLQPWLVEDNAYTIV